MNALGPLLLASHVLIALAMRASWRRRRSHRLVAEHTVEVCLSDIESARVASEGGVNSIELCSDRAGGGVTPSIGLVAQCVQR
jgi:hypothetical protein